MLKRAVQILFAQGPIALLVAAWRWATCSRARTFRTARRLIAGRSGLEIGGPSDTFAAGQLLPVYAVAGALDNCVPYHTTIWGEFREGRSFRFSPTRPPGLQFLGEATALSRVADESYDFVASCHMLEHCANPLKALHEWRRVLRPGGAIFLVLPHKDGTFDHRRPTTTLAHLHADLVNGTGEDDLTHLAEILDLHDLSRDPGAGTRERFEARSRENAVNRGMHHHVFDTALAAEMMLSQGLQLVALEAVLPCHIVALAAKNAVRGGAERPIVRRAVRRSPFPSDRPSSRSGRP